MTNITLKIIQTKFFDTYFQTLTFYLDLYEIFFVWSENFCHRFF